MSSTRTAIGSARACVVLAGAVGLLMTVWCGGSASAGRPHPEAVRDAGQTAPTAAEVRRLVDRVVPEQLAAGKIPGAVVTVVAGGETVLAQGYGVAEVDSGTPMDASATGFYTASIAKLFTATAALQLVENGRLDLDADVNDYLEDFSVPDTYPGRPVTLRNLLTYTSGFDDDIYGWSQWERADMPSLQEFVDRVQPARVRPPGEVTAYNNYDYVLAGRLIEIASGQTYADYLDEHVTGPLGMDATTAAHPHPATLESRLAAGHRPEGDSQVETTGQDSPSTPAGADTITDSSDLARFMIAQLERDPALGRGVARAMQEEQFATDDRISGMGYAFEQRPRNGYQVVVKDGDLPGTHSNLALVPELGLGIHVVYNGDGQEQAAAWGAKELVNRIIDEYAPPTPAPTADPLVDDVSVYAGDYGNARTSQSRFTKVTTLMAPVTVVESGRGRLTTTGLSEDPSVTSQDWIQLAPGLFQRDGGSETIAFTEDGTMSSSQVPNTSYVPLDWYESPSLHLIVVAIAALVLTTAFVAFPVQASVRRLRHRAAHPLGARAARGLAWLTSLCLVVFTAGFALISADPNRLMQLPLTGDPVLSVALNAVSVMALLTVAVLVAAALAWRRRWWTRAGRLAYSSVAVAALAFLSIAVTYRLIGLPFTLTV